MKRKQNVDLLKMQEQDDDDIIVDAGFEQSQQKLDEEKKLKRFKYFTKFRHYDGTRGSRYDDV
jgi:hypothetical protein